MSAEIRPEHLEQLWELNRAFLDFLQLRARTGRECLGLSTAARVALRDADAAALDEAARLPRALFQIDCEAGVDVTSEPMPAVDHDSQQHHVTLQILWAVRQTSRQSPYQAKLLFDLDAGEVEHIGSLALAGLERLAACRRVLRCAFPAQDWLWPPLLLDMRPESRRQLALIALQLGLKNEWPRRRAAHPAR
jgi:hypothetical protein